MFQMKNKARIERDGNTEKKKCLLFILSLFICIGFVFNVSKERERKNNEKIERQKVE